jgi:formylglycine-generating enzyme required for sulfatase activity
MGQTPVTAAAYRRFAEEIRLNILKGQQGDNHPVFDVSWNDALA